jgi:hypothetical protein
MENKEDTQKKSVKIKDEDGLTVSYNKRELHEHFPHLTKELSEKKKILKIKSFESQIEQDQKEEHHKSKSNYPKELYNPGVIDFIRRCTKKEEVISILDYLLERKEISEGEYDSYKKAVSKEGGLERLINESGGLKRPGYYMRKYYKKDMKNQKLNSNKD